MNALLQATPAGFAAVLVVVMLVLAAIVVIEMRRVGQLKRRLDALTRGADGRSLESVFDAHLETVFRVSHDLNALSARTSTLESVTQRHYGRVGLVRFNPFDDTGGNQSFALVLLDEADNGLVVSSLHSRSGIRLYAKTMTGGRCETALSTEESQALDIARSQAVVVETRSAGKSGKGGSARAPIDEAVAATQFDAGRKGGAVAAGRGVRRRSDTVSEGDASEFLSESDSGS